MPQCFMRKIHVFYFVSSLLKRNIYAKWILIGLRDLVGRLEREKSMLDGKAKGAHRELNIKTNILTVKFEEANAEARKLREEMEATRHGQLMGEPQGVETLKLRNKFLQVCYQRYFQNIYRKYKRYGCYML